MCAQRACLATTFEVYQFGVMHRGGIPCFELPTTMLPRRVRMSAKSVVSASTAMISEATAMSKPVFLVMPFSVLDSPTVISRRKRSLMSRTRLHVIVLGSKSTRANLQQALMACTPFDAQFKVENLLEGQASEPQCSQDSVQAN